MTRALRAPTKPTKALSKHRRPADRQPNAIVALQAERLSKTFQPGSSKEVRAVQDVSFQMDEGSVVGLIGPNGAGKSTLLRILLGFLSPDPGGSSSIFGESPESLSARAVTGYQADAPYHARPLTLRYFLQFHASLAGVEDTRLVVDKVLAEFDLAAAAPRPLAALSRGMRQKAEIILAFLGAPRIVFLDEPTAFLDPTAVFHLRDFLKRQKKAGTTILFSSHNLSEVEHACDRVLFMNKGRIVAAYDMRGRSKGFLEQAFRKHVLNGGRS